MEEGAGQPCSVEMIVPATALQDNDPQEGPAAGGVKTAVGAGAIQPDQTHMLMALGEMKQNGQLPTTDGGGAAGGTFPRNASRSHIRRLFRRK